MLIRMKTSTNPSSLALPYLPNGGADKPLHLMEGVLFMEEIWKDVKGWEGCYRISSFGNVKTLLRPRLKSGYLISRPVCGYNAVVLCNKGIRKQYKVHRLVALNFLNKIENKLHINHKNGIKTDNRAENLEWCTPMENIHHAMKTGLIKKRIRKIRPKRVLKGRSCYKGEKNPGRKLNESDVVLIKKSIEKTSNLMVIYRVSRSAINRIRSGSQWTHLTTE